MKKKIAFIVFLLAILIPSFSQIFHKNKGTSQSQGSVSNGKLINAYKVDWKGNHCLIFITTALYKHYQ